MIETITIEKWVTPPMYWDCWQSSTRYPSFFQTSLWANFQSKNGILPKYYIAKRPGCNDPLATALVLTDQIRSFCWEGPTYYGSEGKVGNLAILNKLAISGGRIKVYLPLSEDIETTTLNQRWVVKKCGSFARLIDLSRFTDEIWNSMAPVARRNIRRAEDRGVTFQTEGLEAIGEFRRIATLMPGFDDDWGGFQIDFFEELLQCPGVFLFSVRFKRIMIAAAIITLFHNHAYYLFGVTDRKFQKHRASDFLQYQIMLWLAVHKITSYDLGYVSAKKDNDNPKKVSISRFKKKFGGVNLPHVRLELL